MPSLDNAAKFPLNLQNTTLHSYLTDGLWSMAATFLDGAQYHVLICHGPSPHMFAHQTATLRHTELSSKRAADVLLISCCAMVKQLMSRLLVLHSAMPHAYNTQPPCTLQILSP